MRITLFAMAQYAAIADGNKLVVAGTINQLEMRRAPGAALREGPVVLPAFFLAIASQCSIAEGTEHEMAIRVLDVDMAPVLDEPIPIGTWKYMINKHGRPMMHNQVVHVNGLALPGPGDYTIELLANGKSVDGGDVPLYLLDVTPLEQ